MQENNFEREVRQKAGELKIKPSEEVWQKVAVAIEKRKAGRRVIAFILLLLLLAGSGLVMLMDTKPGNSNSIAVQPANSPAQVKKNNQPDNSISDITDNNKNARDSGNSSSADHFNTPTATVATPGKISLSKKLVTISPATPPTEENSDNDVPNKYNNATRKNINYASRQKLSSKVSQADTGEDLTTEPATEEQFASKFMLADNQPIQLLPVEVLKGGILIAGYKEDKFSLSPRPVNDIATVNALRKATAVKPAPAWKFGILLSGGISATRSGYFGLIGVGGGENKAFDLAQSNVGSGTTAPPSGITYSPSQISSGPGLLAGVFAHRNISPKTELSVGLSYKLLSSAMLVGNRIDTGSFYSQFGNSYRLGTRNNYHNHFHFIELPVAVQYRFSKSNQLPVYLKAGLSLSQLLSTNALQFDSQSGNYYKDNGLLNKTQLSITTGLLFSLSRHSANALVLGPDLHFGLTKMAGSGLYSGRRYSYFGLLLQKTIGKK